MKRYSYYDINNYYSTGAPSNKDGDYIKYTDHKAVVETLENENLRLENETIYLSNRIEELEKSKKEYCDLLVNPYDYSDREKDEIIERAEEYLDNNKV